MLAAPLHAIGLTRLNSAWKKGIFGARLEPADRHKYLNQ